MSDSVELNRTQYTVPDIGDTGWGTTLAAYLSALASSMSTFLTFGGTSGAGGATVYAMPCNGAADATERKIRMPFACVCSAMSVVTTSVPSAQSVVVTLRVNGADTSTAVTLTTADTEGQYTSDVQIAAGDDISVKLAQAGGGGGAANLVVALAFHASTGD